MEPSSGELDDEGWMPVDFDDTTYLDLWEAESTANAQHFYDHEFLSESDLNWLPELTDELREARSVEREDLTFEEGDVSSDAYDLTVDERAPETGYLTRAHLIVTCNGGRRQPHRSNVVAVLRPYGGYGDHGGFIINTGLGQHSSELREKRTDPERSVTQVKFRLRCTRCGRDTQIAAERLRELYFSLRDARDAGVKAATGRGGSIHLEMSALPF